MNKIYPLNMKSSLIFKLEKGYISYGNIYVDIINIDFNNDIFEFYDSSYITTQIKIPHKYYETTTEIIEYIINQLKNYAIEMTYEKQVLKLVSGEITIIENNLTKFIQLTPLNTVFKITEYNIGLINLQKPSIFYTTISSSVDSSTNNEQYILQSYELIEGYNTININFQNDYDDLYLTITSNINLFPLRYNTISYLLYQS